MLQKEDVVNQFDQSLPNFHKSPNRLTTILISVVILAIVGIGGYTLGARQRQFLPTNPLTKPEPGRLPSATPIQQLSPTPANYTSQPTSTVNWTTYTNTAVGYTIKYPSDKFIECNIQGEVSNFTLFRGGTQTRQCATGEERPFLVLTMESSEKDFSISNYPQCYKRWETNTMVNGIPAKQYRNIILDNSGACAFPSSADRNYTNIVFTRNNQTFVVSYWEDDDVIRQAILSTLEFFK